MTKAGISGSVSQPELSSVGEGNVNFAPQSRPVFKLLTDHGNISPLDPTGQGKPGSLPEVYAVNPLWVRDVPE